MSTSADSRRIAMQAIEAIDASATRSTRVLAGAYGQQWTIGTALKQAVSTTVVNDLDVAELAIVDRAFAVLGGTRKTGRLAQCCADLLALLPEK